MSTTPETSPQRNETGRFLPGTPSPNPSGRPAVDPKVKRETHEVLAAATPKAARRLVELMDSPDERIALTASQLVLDRVYGKPVQQVDAKVETTNVQQAHLQILLELQGKFGRQAPDAGPSRDAHVIEHVEVLPAPAPEAAAPIGPAGKARAAALRSFRINRSPTMSQG